MDSEATSSASLYSLTSSCVLVLDRLLNRLGNYPTLGDLKDVSEDNAGRFRVWIGNIGALQPPKSTKSLDYRLRSATYIRTGVLTGLERLKNLATRAVQFLSDSEKDYGGAYSRARLALDPIAEPLRELVLGIQSSISHLFALSMIIRRHRPRGRFPLLDTFTPLEASPDISGVSDKYPKTKRTPWLSKRLGNAITLRRQFIQYRQEHRQKLGNAHVGGAIDDSSTIAGSTLATTYVEDLKSSHPGQSSDTALNRLSVCTFATSFMTDSEGEAIGRRIPDLTDMVMEGVQGEYDKAFECPYCRTIQTMGDRFEWKSHVFADLQPYVCTFEDCPSPSTLFPTRREWIDHELKVHQCRWSCNLCSASGGAAFDTGTEEDMMRHLQTRHAGMVAESQMQTILDAFKQPVRHIKFLSCPLCDEWEPPDPSMDPGSPSRHYYRHLARHQQLLALESLPLSIEGLEINVSEEEADVEESEDESDSESLSESPRTFQCPTCQTRWFQYDGGMECPHCRTRDIDKPLLPVKLPGVFERPRPAPPAPSLPTVEDEYDPYFNSGHKVLWLATSLFAFDIEATKLEAGYPYLTYQTGEIFDVIAEKGELWLALNQDDPSREVGWIWSKHFAKLADW